LNRDYAAILCDGKASLHLIEPVGNHSHDVLHQEVDHQTTKIFQSSNNSSRSFGDEKNTQLSSIALTKDFFIYSTSNGTGSIHFFYLKEWKFLEGCAYRHDDGTGIVQLAPNHDGTRIVFMDDRRKGYMLNPTTRDVQNIPSITSTTTGIVWDTMDPTVFVTFQPNEFSLFLHCDCTVNGPEVTQLGFMEIHSNGDFVMAPQSTSFSADLSPILVCDGVVTCQHSSGKISSITSCTHDQLQKTSKASGETDKAIFRQLLSLLRLDLAWKYASTIDSRDYWRALAGRAMQVLDISMANRVYRQLGDAGMVLGLERIEYIEEKNLLAGHVLMLFGDYVEAQKLFLNSSEPMAALQMQKYLLQWEQALKLADNYAVALVPELSVSYATQLEFRGEFEGALKMYEHAINVVDETGNVVLSNTKLHQQSLAGVARCTLRLGDLRRGIRLVSDLGDTNVCKECAVILEGLKQFQDAAALYERGEQFEKAAQIYIQMKNLSKAAPLMKQVKTPKIHAQFGRAKEAAGEYSAASDAYEAANDMDNVVRIQIEHLHHPEKAFTIVRETKSSEAALAVAKYCTESGNFSCAIEFLLLANKEEEAFQLAQSHGEMDSFTKILGESISVERAAKVAVYYEQNQFFAQSAEFYQICGNYHKALRLFLQGGDSALSKAIDVVGKARNEMLTHTLIDHLMGETDGIPKDPNHIFRLYMALGNYTQAAKTATIISRQEQELGNYKVAHDVLVETVRQLQLHKIHINQELRNSLMLLHSYIVVKKLVKRNDHMAAARMLIRVVKYISKFPNHITNLLISAVIECQRAGLKAYSYDYATMLMRPEYRNTIDKEIKRKIEAIVRRPNKEQAPDTTSPCPFCQNELEDAELDCSKCKNTIPYCIVTGYHMVKHDWSHCPRCQFPALYTHFSAHLEQDPGKL
jgi:WD repeat-containing protein 19